MLGLCVASRRAVAKLVAADLDIARRRSDHTG
jgi:hypothetical protein